MTLMLALAVVLSFAMGMSLGLLGGGGSILAVPILIYVLGVETKDAIATSLLVVGATSAVALARHAYVGHVRWRIGALFAAMSMAGAYAGGRAAAYVAPVVLLMLLAGMMIATAVAMLRPGGIGVAAGQRGGAARQVVAQAFGLGAFTGLVGAGGGFLVVPTLLLLGGLSMRDAIGTSLLVIALNTLAGFAGHASHASVDWMLAALVAAVAAAGAVAGGLLSTTVPQAALRRAFACLVLGLAIFLLIEQLPQAVRSVLLAWWPAWVAAAALAAAVLCRRASDDGAAIGART